MAEKTSGPPSTADLAQNTTKISQEAHLTGATADAARAEYYLYQKLLENIKSATNLTEASQHPFPKSLTNEAYDRWVATKPESLAVLNTARKIVTNDGLSLEAPYYAAQREAINTLPGSADYFRYEKKEKQIWTERLLKELEYNTFKSYSDADNTYYKNKVAQFNSDPAVIALNSEAKDIATKKNAANNQVRKHFDELSKQPSVITPADEANVNHELKANALRLFTKELNQSGLDANPTRAAQYINAMAKINELWPVIQKTASIAAEATKEAATTVVEAAKNIPKLSIAQQAPIVTATIADYKDAATKIQPLVDAGIISAEGARDYAVASSTYNLMQNATMHVDRSIGAESLNKWVYDHPEVPAADLDKLGLGGIQVIKAPEMS